MRFAKYTFLIAGIYGLVVLLPQYFFEQKIGIDSPPAISFTDAAILSTLVDGVVLVAMANKSSIHLMRRFKQRLGTIGARIYGVVLNGLKSGSIEYEYYGSGYYNYYKSADADSTTPVIETNGSNESAIPKI